MTNPTTTLPYPPGNVHLRFLNWPVPRVREFMRRHDTVHSEICQPVNLARRTRGIVRGCRSSSVIAVGRNRAVAFTPCRGRVSCVLGIFGVWCTVT